MTKFQNRTHIVLSMINSQKSACIFYVLFFNYSSSSQGCKKDHARPEFLTPSPFFAYILL